MSALLDTQLGQQRVVAVTAAENLCHTLPREAFRARQAFNVTGDRQPGHVINAGADAGRGTNTAAPTNAIDVVGSRRGCLSIDQRAQLIRGNDEGAHQ